MKQERAAELHPLQNKELNFSKKKNKKRGPNELITANNNLVFKGMKAKIGQMN